jgi:predicted permease
VFVVAQLSLSLVLLLGAGLSLRALQNAVAIDLGFNQERLLTASYDLVLQNYPRERRELFRRDLLARVEALPSIESATLTSVPPLSGTMVSTIVTGRSADGSPAESRAYLNAVASRYFETMEIGLLAGRGIGVGDRAGAPPVAVINETLARRIWGSAAEAVGRTIDIGDETLSVVGVARDSKYDEATEDARPFLYTALSQQAQLDRETLIVRTSGAPAAAAASVLAQIRSLDRAMPVFDVRTMETVLQERADKQRGISAMLLAFGLLALGLAALGLYGVMAYTVTLRTREMGLRLALGARPAQLTRLVAGDALRLALTGAAIGLVLSVPLAYALGALVLASGSLTSVRPRARAVFCSRSLWERRWCRVSARRGSIRWPRCASTSSGRLAAFHPYSAGSRSAGDRC